MNKRSVIVTVLFMFAIEDYFNFAIPIAKTREIASYKKSPEERRKSPLFLKTNKKFVVTEAPIRIDSQIKAVSIYTPAPFRKPLMRKFVISDKTSEANFYHYKVPVTRPPLMKPKQFIVEVVSLSRRENIEENMSKKRDDVNESENQEDAPINNETVPEEDDYLEEEFHESDDENINNDQEDISESQSHEDKSTVNKENFEENDYFEEDFNRSQKENINIAQEYLTKPDKSTVDEAKLEENDYLEEDFNESVEENSEDINEPQIHEEKYLFDVTIPGEDEYLEENFDELHEASIHAINNEYEEVNNSQSHEDESTINVTILDEHLNQSGEEFVTETVDVIEDSIDSRGGFMPSYTVVDDLIAESDSQEFIFLKRDDPAVADTSKSKRSVNVIEEESLGTTVSGYEYTGTVSHATSDLSYKNINL